MFRTCGLAIPGHACIWEAECSVAAGPIKDKRELQGPEIVYIDRTLLEMQTAEICAASAVSMS